MGITLKAARVNKNLNQLEAVEQIGVSKSTLQKYEAGKSYPDIPILKSIERVYGINYADLIFLPSENA
jgi:transcriptional regulator with XRE-family HTH domain